MDCTCFAKTVPGATHLSRGIPCEDASGCHADPAGRYAIAVVADGHGDPTCVRSARGASLAVDVTLDILRAYAEGRMARGAHAEGEEPVQTDAILARWSQTVIADYESDPLEDESWARLGLQGFSELAATDRRRSHAIEHLYGSTLVAVLMLPDRCIALQQGDGLAVVVTADGSVVKPVPDDPLCHQNVTTSLSDANASVEFRQRQVVVPRSSLGGVVACFVASDGIDKSLPNVAATKNYFRGMAIEAVATDGRHQFEELLGGWFANLSAAGIGDDVSCAGIVDRAAMADAMPRIAERRERSQRKQDRYAAHQKLRAMADRAEYLRQRPELEEGEAFLAEYARVETLVHQLDEEAGGDGSGARADDEETVEIPLSDLSAGQVASPAADPGDDGGVPSPSEEPPEEGTQHAVASGGGEILSGERAAEGGPAPMPTGPAEWQEGLERKGPRGPYLFLLFVIVFAIAFALAMLVRLYVGS